VATVEGLVASPRAWQKPALLLLPVAVAAIVLAVVSDQRSASSVTERPAVEVRPGEPHLNRGLIVFDGCSRVDDAGVVRDARMLAQVADSSAELEPGRFMRNRRGPAVPGVPTYSDQPGVAPAIHGRGAEG